MLDQGTPPDIILTDLHMPKMSGDQVIKELRSSNRTKHIPIILITADSFHELETQYGIIELLPKPFKKEDLYTLLAKYLT